MTIKELDDKLNSPGFQDTENGDLFYKAVIYDLTPFRSVITKSNGSQKCGLFFINN